ncbi:MAG: hypothetical protein M3401_16475 [Actinomycetota bacterium]|nr:hypothetical protein [Actinomycetota bacterium]
MRQLFEAPPASALPVDRERWLAGAARLAASVVSAQAPELGANPGSGSVLHGLYWLSANLSIEAPLLLAVDDAQWADDASIAFLSYLARRVDELAILIIYASRVGEGASAALPAVTEPTLTSTVLRPQALTATATAQFVARLLGEAGSTRFAQACHLATAGNPFLLGDLVRSSTSMPPGRRRRVDQRRHPTRRTPAGVHPSDRAHDDLQRTAAGTARDEPQARRAAARPGRRRRCRARAASTCH